MRKKYQNPKTLRTVTTRDLNKARISARQLLLHSTLRIKRGLRLYESMYGPSNLPTRED